MPLPPLKRPWSDKQFEGVIATLLTAGVALAAVVVLSGGILYLYRYGSASPDYRLFRGEPSDLRNLSGIIKDAAAFRSRGIIQLGLLLLIATPVARVALSVFAFLQQRDRLYVGITLAVLALLLYSMTFSTG